ncbi:GIY-YIG nuclease family protein [Homoserinimonas sp. A520]
MGRPPDTHALGALVSEASRQRSRGNRGTVNPLSNAGRVLSPEFLTKLVDVHTAPREKGVYAWWFTPSALSVPTNGYAMAEGRELLYAGIAPRKPSSAGIESASRLRARLTTHARKDASRSTLRLSLGVLLLDELGLTLGMHRGRLNWGPEGELELTRWMNEHARISWVVDDEPWELESELLAGISLPLNVDGRSDAFAVSLSERRRQLRRGARLKT